MLIDKPLQSNHKVLIGCQLQSKHKSTGGSLGAHIMYQLILQHEVLIGYHLQSNYKSTRGPYGSSNNISPNWWHELMVQVLRESYLLLGSMSDLMLSAPGDASSKEQTLNSKLSFQSEVTNFWRNSKFCSRLMNEAMSIFICVTR